MTIPEEWQRLAPQPRPLQGDQEWNCRTALLELFLLQKDYAKAAAAYRSAVDSALAETGSHRSTWTQTKRLTEKLNPSDEERSAISEAFQHLQGQTAQASQAG